MDLYSIRNQRISPQKREEFPLLSFCSARAWHSLLAERHTEKKKSRLMATTLVLLHIAFPLINSQF